MMAKEGGKDQEGVYGLVGRRIFFFGFWFFFPETAA
jgi:hypothetical protein